MVLFLNDRCLRSARTWAHAGIDGLYIDELHTDGSDYLDNVRTRGARDLDLSIYKSFKITESMALRFDISSYNLTNTPQYGYPNVLSVTNAAQPGSNFGQITSTVNTPRQFQFGARFTF